MATRGKKDDPVAKKAKRGNQGVGYGQEMRKATKEEKQAFRQAGGRKEAKKGNLVGIYDESKGARLYNKETLNPVNDQFITRTHTKGEMGKQSAKVSNQGRSGGAGAKEIARQENSDFYGATRFGRRMTRKATKAGGAGISGGFTKAQSKKSK